MNQGQVGRAATRMGYTDVDNHDQYPGDPLAAAADAMDYWSEVQREAEAARIAYHQAIQRAYRAGASAREIADNLRIGVQAVADIVEPVELGDWHTRLLPTIPTCGFCSAPTSVTRPLITGPHVRICTGCALLGRKIIADGRGAADRRGPLQFVSFASTAACSFCGVRASAAPALLTAGGAQICSHCIDICVKISPTPAAAAR